MMKLALKNLRLLPLLLHGAKNCTLDPNPYRNRQKAGMGRHPKPHARDPSDWDQANSAPSGARATDLASYDLGAGL